MYSIEKIIAIRATPCEVFDALTNAARIVIYYAAEYAFCEAKVGGDIQICFRDACEGNVFGKIHRFERDRVFEYTCGSAAMEIGGETKAPVGGSVRYLIAGHGDEVWLRLLQSNLSSEEHSRRMAVTWEYVLQALKLHAEGEVPLFFLGDSLQGMAGDRSETHNHQLSGTVSSQTTQEA